MSILTCDQLSFGDFGAGEYLGPHLSGCGFGDKLLASLHWAEVLFQGVRPKSDLSYTRTGSYS